MAFETSGEAPGECDLNINFGSAKPLLLPERGDSIPASPLHLPAFSGNPLVSTLRAMGQRCRAKMWVSFFGAMLFLRFKRKPKGKLTIYWVPFKEHTSFFRVWRTNVIELGSLSTPFGLSRRLTAAIEPISLHRFSVAFTACPPAQLVVEPAELSSSG